MDKNIFEIVPENTTDENNVVPLVETTENASDFSFKEFREKSAEFEEDVKSFVFIGVRTNGDLTLSAKADSNMHLYWILKRFMANMERSLFE